MVFRLSIAFTICTFFVSDVTAQTRRVEFGRDIYPILKKACFECHGSKKQEGELRLDIVEAYRGETSVTAGLANDNELLRRVNLPKGHDEAMPAIGDPLSQRQTDLLRRWIEQKTGWPESFIAPPHWSYVKPTKPVIPKLDQPQAWSRNEIDHFVAAKLAEHRLKHSPEATPETLVRRLSLDLTGLPPSPATVRAFVADPTEAAYEKLVDSFLQQPQFGERWARPWLDLARYADSHGFQRDNFRDVWAYRDWVIKALNADMPFDEFTIEQIAGDLLPNASESQKIATGFHRCTPTNVEAGSLPEETRIEQVIDRVNTTGAVWLGSTVECCQCHNHKYDPFSAKDYYGLLAFFNNTEMEADRLNPKSPSSIAFKGPKMELSDTERDQQRTVLNQKIAELTQQRQQRRKELNKQLPAWAKAFAATTSKAPQIHVLPIIDFRSKGTDDGYKTLEDNSVLLNGVSPPSTDVYKINIKPPQNSITAFRIDALTHDELPGNGPGRGETGRPNFVLNEVTAAIVTDSGQTRPLKFSGATADFSQKGWDISGALSSKPKTGWAISPQFGKPHWATFVLQSPLTVPRNEHVHIKLVFNFGRARSMGRVKLSAITGNPGADSIPADALVALKAAPKSWSKKDRNALLAYRVSRDENSLQLQQGIDAIEKQQKQLQPDTTLVMIELPEPRMSYIFERGDYRSQGDAVQPTTPDFLHDLPDGPANRLTLAKWLVDKQNPLVARVTVNRWWAEIFGRGIVPTLDDFGFKGDEPSHPELLDWLAVEFMENDWSMKHILKTIVMSATYRQSSFVAPKAREIDPDNIWLARGTRIRMDAEMIRDNLLSIAGLLSTKQFGPSIRPFQPDGIWSKVGGESYKYKVSEGEDKYRRGIYVVTKRGAPYPSFINFDATARLGCVVQRSRTNTPLQALTLLNDPVYVEAAEALAMRILRDLPESDETRRINYAFQLCTSRTPDETEAGIILDLLETQRSVERSKADAQQADDMTLPSGVTSADLNAWKNVAAALLNLHETITKN